MHRQSVEVYCQSSLIATFTYVYKEGSGVLSEIWDDATLNFESSNLIADIRQNYVSMA